MATYPEILFTKTDVIELAKCVAQLIREGVTFHVEQMADGWRVQLTGGY